MQSVVQLLELCEGGGYDDSLMESELVVHPHKGGVDLALRYPAYRAIRCLAVMLSAYPQGKPIFCLLPRKNGAAFPANDFLRQGIFYKRIGDALCSFFHQGLYSFKGFSFNDGRMGTLCVVLIGIPLVELALIGECICGKGFLAEGVTNVFFICEYFSDHLFMPYPSIPGGGDALFRHPGGDPFCAVSAEIGLEDPANQLGFFRDDL